MRAATQFASKIVHLKPTRLSVELFGSLGLTGKGHGTDGAIISGLMGAHPESVDPSSIPSVQQHVEDSKCLKLPNGETVQFNPSSDLKFNRKKSLPHHPNGMHFSAYGPDGEECLSEKVYSLGGGFIIHEEDIGELPDPIEIPYPFSNAEELVGQAEETDLPISEMVLENENAWRNREKTVSQLDAIWKAMQDCVASGLQAEGFLPGPMKVPRRAPALYQQLCHRPESALKDPLSILDWVDVYAIAVNEQNAAGGRVVTAPTNGAAGIIPAVMHYCDRFLTPRSPDWHRAFLLTAGAIGLLFKENASISGADVGCQGEVGVACSMAAAGLAEFMGGSPRQIENAAEIGMEHNLGLTCDPIGGLVQIPCIERNAMGSVKAINAARIALRGDGRHSVSLDAVIRTMRETGKDMRRKYKETSTGGLAVNVVEC